MARDRHIITSYAVALAAVAAAITIRAALTPWLGLSFPLATMFSAVAFVVWYAGWGPALFTTLAGFIAADAAFARGASIFQNGVTLNESVSIVVYVASCASIIVLGEAMRSAQRTLEAGQRTLASTNLTLAGQVEAQSLLAAIVASSEDAILSKTLDGEITSWNKGAERLFGYTAEEVIGQSMMLLIPPELAEEEQALLARIRRGERVEHLEVQRIAKSGQRLHVSMAVSPVHDQLGRISGASTTARDITARKESEARLERHAAVQRLLVAIQDATRGLQDPAEVMRETVMHVGRHFTVARCAYGEIDLEESQIVITEEYAHGVDDIAGRYRLDTFGPPLIEGLKAGRTAVVSDVRRDPLTDTANARALYAHIEIVSLICVPLRRHGRLFAVLAMGDAVPRVWAEEDIKLLEQIAERTLFAVESARASNALRENRDVLQFAMASGKMGAWSRNLVLDTVWWSPELAAIFGLPPGAADYRRDMLFGLVPEADRERLPRLIQTALDRHEEYAIEFRFRHATTGEWRWVEVRGKATYGADGTPHMMYGLGIDITDHRRAVEALEEADRRKNEFLATLAHELRNPLAPIRSGLHILRAPGRDAGAAAQAIEIMERQVTQMVRLVDDLLDVARITTGKTDLQLETMDLADAIADAVETSRPLLAAGGQPLEIRHAVGPVYVRADRTRLAQVFANLLNNSAKYSESGQPVSLVVEQESGQAIIRLRDAGIGIHPESLPHIFDMFRQADGTGSRARGGLGIGLFLVKRIVEMHGGTVNARSEGLGLGAEFEVRLPLEAVVRPRRAPQAAPFAHAAVPRRILVVDDSVDAAEALCALLSIIGHETRLAHDGPTAVATAAEFRPDMVFLDIGLPTIDGHETARRIRAEPWGRDLVLVALTGWGQAEDRERSRAAGFDHHLVKPADPGVVVQLIADL